MLKMINFNDNTIKKTKEHYPNCQSVLDTDTDYQKSVVLDQEKQTDILYLSNEILLKHMNQNINFP